MDTVVLSKKEKQESKMVNPKKLLRKIEFDIGAETNCSRCKKKFEQEGPVPFKTCGHCRELQRQRSRRWQVRTKEKDGVCTRCGVVIPEEHNQFVLCPNCRMSLRSRKLNRGAQGKCVHCARVLDVTKTKFKVCERCRENDRNRRQNLESQGHCIRCAKSLDNEPRKTKICDMCRDRRNNPNLLPNARIPNIINAAYKSEFLKIKSNENNMTNDDDDDEVLRAAQMIIPNYSSNHYEGHLTNEAVTATLVLVLNLADENSLLEGNYFTVEKN